MDDKLVESLLNQILIELKGVNQRLDKLEARVGSLETRVDSLEEDMRYMKGREDEVYNMLRGWKESRSLVDSHLDKLNIDVLKQKKHIHERVLTTKEPALKQAKAR